MTLIIAQKYDDCIVMAGDSSVCFTDSNHTRIGLTKKVNKYERDDIILAGAGGSYRLISLLNQFIPPKIRMDYEGYGIRFANAWKEYLKDHDALSAYDDGLTSQNGGVIVAVRDHVFEISSDFGAIEYEEFVAGGSARLQAYAIHDYQKSLYGKLDSHHYKETPEFMIGVLSKNNGEIVTPIQQEVIQ